MKPMIMRIERPRSATTYAVFGTCAKCGNQVTDVGIHVQRRKVIPSEFPGCAPTIMFGPETDVFHPECTAVELPSEKGP